MFHKNAHSDLQLQKEEAASWHRILSVIGVRPVKSLHPWVWEKIISQIEIENKPAFSRDSRWLANTFGITLAIVVLVCLWFAIRPGAALEWTVSGDLPRSFRIYRASRGSQDFQVIRQVESQLGVYTYQFVDIFTFPGVAYSYRVEGLEPGGESTLSETVGASPLAALTLQLMIILISSLAGYTALLTARTLKIHKYASLTI
jgi:hypothetical protein